LIKYLDTRKLFLVLLIGLITGPVFSEVFPNETSSLPIESIDSPPKGCDLRLMSFSPSVRNESLYSNQTEQSMFSSKIERKQNIITSSSHTGISPNLTEIYPTYKITSGPDLNITKVTPEAMERDASLMTFILNFTIPEKLGLGSDTVKNLTLNNGSDFLITGWSDGWAELKDENGTYIDEYSLTFTLNNSFLSSLAFGAYDLVMHVNVSGYLSSDSVPLPMRDVWVEVKSVLDPEFNNRFYADQFFTVEIEVRNYTSQSSFSWVNSLPLILDENGTNINPSVTIKQTQPISKIGSLKFVEFLDNPLSGRFTMNYSLSETAAQEFEEGEHQLVVSVTTKEWISDNASIQFIAKGTVYFVVLEEITVESNPPIDYDSLMTGSQEGVTYRLNVNGSINIRFHVYDNEQQINSTRRHEIGYQDPNNPNPFAILYNSTENDGTGNITLLANKITSADGYHLLFFVRGHRTSQENNKPSNITIFWDLLNFNYTYYDNHGHEGTRTSLNSKALGVDVNESWSFKLGLYYASDGTRALGGNISYRFAGGIWYNSTDGLNEDVLDGLFNIGYIHPVASEILFECQILSGSRIDPQGTLFVNKTRGSAYFNITVTWTYLIIDMTSVESDSRLSIIGGKTALILTATWAHNTSLPFNGFAFVKDHDRNILRDVSMFAGEGILPSLVKLNTGRYRYSVTHMDDDVPWNANPFGITKFTNSSLIKIEDPQVQVDLIWEAIHFTCSNSYDPSIPPDQQDWGIPFFFSNYGEITTLYIYGRHSYDNSPFNGTATLYAFEITEPYTVTFTNGVGEWYGNLTGQGFEITFGIMKIVKDIDFGITWVGNTQNVKISWDKIVITLEADMTYSHGTWADINVSFEYLIFKDESVNLTTVKYNLLLSNNTERTDISWTHFRDYSFSPLVRSYNITSLYDNSTGLSGFETHFKWLDQGIEEAGNLTICWIDDKPPSILEIGAYDFGNGTILLIVDVTDDSEDWHGSGIGSVVLLNEILDQPFPGEPSFYQISPGIYRYFFSYTYNQTVGNNFFQFDFNDTLKFSFKVTDKGTPTPPFPAWLETLRNPHAIISNPISLVANNDLYKPQFIKKDGVAINVSFITLTSDNLNIKEGDTIISVSVQDTIWSGLTNSSVRLIVSEWSSSMVIKDVNMTLIDKPSNLGDKRSEFQFNWQGNLQVFQTYQLIVIVTDIAGNVNNRTLEVEIEDNVAPRVIEVVQEKTGDRKLKVTVIIEETGGGIDYIMVKIGDQDGWFNLSLEGGTGASVQETATYTAIIPLEFDPLNIIQDKKYPITVKVADKIGNEMEYASQDYNFIDDFFLPPLIFEPIIWILGLILFVAGVVVGVRITSKTVGYDMKKILVESERITREVILTNMDEYALGVTVNFFDQVQGPVPVIWEPPLLEDQEQVMLDLSDKSFSALEFVGLEEKERSGTFDFSTGSYECTALGYSFAIANPEARGGKENLTIVLLLRKEWGDNLLTFQDELLEKLREIRELIEREQPSSMVEKKARELREFVSRVMIAFNKIYTGIEYEVSSLEE